LARELKTKNKIKKNQTISEQEISIEKKMVKRELLLSAQITLRIDAFDNLSGTFCGRLSIFS
jgi:hypothetical protein